MAKLRLRCKTDTGTHTLPLSLSATSTLQDLKDVIFSICGVRPDSQKILNGYPPKPVDLSNSSATLSHLNVNSGDTFTVVNTLKVESSSKAPSASVEMKPQMKRMEVPADNSCLFYSVYFALNGVLNKTFYEKAKQYRQNIANIVISNPMKYSEVFLEKSPNDYAVWIQSDTSWGGAIELSILAEYFKVEIVALDIQSLRSDRFGQDHNYSSRVFLLYDGAHYDAVYLDPGVAYIPIQTVFQTTDNEAFDQALVLAREANLARQYVDFTNFSLRCLTCNVALKGQKAAKEHAENTGHGNFGEY